MSLSLLHRLLARKNNKRHRRYERYRADFPLTATALRDDGYLVLQGRCSDIALGGMGVILSKPAGVKRSIGHRISNPQIGANNVHPRHRSVPRGLGSWTGISQLVQRTAVRHSRIVCLARKSLSSW